MSKSKRTNTRLIQYAEDNIMSRERRQQRQKMEKQLKHEQEQLRMAKKLRGE